MGDNQIDPIVLKYYDKQAFLTDDCFPFDKVDYTRIVILPNCDEDADIYDFIILIYPTQLDFGRRIGAIHSSNIENGTGKNKETMNLYAMNIINRINDGFLIPFIESCIKE
jgi:hypothetical protein